MLKMLMEIKPNTGSNHSSNHIGQYKKCYDRQDNSDYRAKVTA